MSREVRGAGRVTKRDAPSWLPANYKPTSLKAGPMVNPLDLGIHNVQGINVWANTAPRGWGSIQRKYHRAT